METFTDNRGIVYFEAPELNIPKGEHPVDTVFYFPQAWLRVLAWGEPATLVGHRMLAYPKGEYRLLVVLDRESGIVGYHPNKVVDTETGLPVFAEAPKIEKKPLSQRARKKLRKQRRKKGK